MLVLTYTHYSINKRGAWIKLQICISLP